MALTKRYVSVAGSGTYVQSLSNTTPMNLATAAANVVAGDWVQVQKGTYNESASDTIVNAGTSASQIVWEGVNTDWSQIVDGRTSGNGPLITTNFPTIAYASTFNLSTTSFNLFRHISFTGTFSGAVVVGANSGVFESCAFANASTNAAAIGLSAIANSTVADCDGALTGGSGGLAALNITAAGSVVVGGRYTGGAGAPAISISVGAIVRGATIFNSTIGLTSAQTSQASEYDSLTVVGNFSDGIKFTGTVTIPPRVTNCLITDNGGFPINGGATIPLYTRNNEYRNNTAGNVVNGAADWTTASGIGNVTGNGASDYVNAAGQNYALALTSPAIAAGLPSFAEIGALNGNSNSTDPGVSNVRSGTTYTIAGVGKTGTLVASSAIRLRTRSLP